MIRYQSLSNIENNHDPSKWWLANKDSFQKFRFAKKYLSALLSSVESERICSVGGTLYSPKRNKMMLILENR